MSHERAELAIDLWSWRLALDGGEIERLAALLSPDERARARRFVFDRHRMRFVAARGGLREILGGIVTVTITIEAKGIIERQLGPGVTNMTAQVTFGLDISIFLVINISFSESWQETRQIA